MKKSIILFASALLFASSAFAVEPTQLNWYGFIRSYAIYDTHASSAGTESLYYYMPTDTKDNVASANFVALTSRLGVDVKGYEVEGYKVTAKIEADFYSENGTTAIMRMRQAYFTMAKGNATLKIGQAWHPMAADLPDIFSLESGAPFGPFSRSPLAQYVYNIGNGMSFNAAAIWQMQYTSTGPDGASAKYIKSSCLPELYLGLTFKGDKGTAKIGADYLSIKPYGKTRFNSMNFFFYGQTTLDQLTLKTKLTYSTDGSHMNLIGGYGICGGKSIDDFEFSGTNTTSGWFTASYKGFGKIVPSLFLGYAHNQGTREEVSTFWCKQNAHKLQNLYRFQPEVVYNLGKVQFGAEYMLTSAQYAEVVDSHMKVVEGKAHWVDNNRIQFIFKYTF